MEGVMEAVERLFTNPEEHSWLELTKTALDNKW